MLRIRLFRTGKKHQPSFKIVVIDKKKAPRGGRFVDELGFWNPISKERSLDKEKAKQWLAKGAQPSDTIHNLLVQEGVLAGKKIDVHKKSKKKPTDTKGSSEAKPADAKSSGEAKEEKPAEEKATEEVKPEEPKPEEPKQEETKPEKPVKEKPVEEAKPEKKKEEPKVEKEKPAEEAKDVDKNI